MLKLGLREQALYFEKDTRQNLYEFHQLPKEKTAQYPDIENIKANALAVACLMTTHELVETSQGYELSSSVLNLRDRVAHTYIDRKGTETFNVPLSPTEKFGMEPAPGLGTAFLVADDLILSAGHCFCRKKSAKRISKEELKKIRAVFRYHKTDPLKDKTKFSPDDVYKVAKVLFCVYDPVLKNEAPDWALIQLDRKVIGIKPISIGCTVSLGADIYAITCPSGTAVKCSSLGYSKVQEISINHIKCKVDTFGGSSGGPIIDRITGRAIALVVIGPRNYVKTQENTVINFRVTPKMLESGEASYTTCQRILPEMFDFHGSVAKEGRKLRKQRFKAYVAEFFGHYFDETKKAKWPNKSYINEKFQAALATMSTLKLNFWQACLLQDWRQSWKIKSEKLMRKLENIYNLRIRFPSLKNNQLALPEKRMLRDEIVYFSDSIWQGHVDLYDMEVNVFNRRFSPEKILDLLLFEQKRNVTFDNYWKELILTHMQKYTPIHHDFNISEKERLEMVEQAWFKVTVKDIKRSPEYQDYPRAFIHAIAKLAMEDLSISYEDARLELELPPPYKP